MKQTTKGILEGIKSEKKIVNSIKEDVGYDIIYESYDKERWPVEYFMSVPLNTTFKSLVQ